MAVVKEREVHAKVENLGLPISDLYLWLKQTPACLSQVSLNFLFYEANTDVTHNFEQMVWLYLQWIKLISNIATWFSLKTLEINEIG